jgi:peptidoglycan/xylan/chitin deacetylase (PgdA/CDA1 family)
LKTNIKSGKFKIFSAVAVGIAIAMLILALLSPFPAVDSKPSSTSHHGKTAHAHSSSASNTIANSGGQGSNIGSSNIGIKVVMINFDDGWKSQSTYAKPILDKYGFKASFFIPCAKMQTYPKWLTWQQITGLKNDGMDIESHTMTHAHLPDLLSSPSQLTYEIGFAKQCLSNHGFNTTIFGYPLNLGSDNPTIVNLVAKYYSFARSGSDPLMFLNCKGYVKEPQNDCRTYSADGRLTYANRYDIRSDSFGHIDSFHNYSPSQEFQKFVQRMNSQIPYNTNGKINAVPIIVYHNLTYSMQDYNGMASTITVPLFAQEMQYLHDNGFKVLVLNQLGYDTTNNIFFLNNSPNTTTTTASATKAGL